MVIDATGEELARAAVATPFASSADGIDMSVTDLEQALRDVVVSLGPTRQSVAAVGVTGMAESGAPFRAGRPTGPIIAWHDGRGVETVASLEARFGADLPRWTGRRVRTVSSLAKLGWLLDHGLPVPDRWLGVPELALFLLTGMEATEHSLAARTGAYQVAERRFLPEVIAHALAAEARPPGGTGWPPNCGEPTDDGGAAELFPPVLPAGTSMGVVSEEAAATHGLPAGIPVTIAGHDHLAAAAGLGAEPDDLFNSVGTAETLLRRLATVPDLSRALELDLAVTVWPGGEAWCVLASATRSGLVIDALAAHLGIDPTRLDKLVGIGGPSEGLALGMERPGTGCEGPATVREGRGRLVALGQGIEVPEGPPAEMWTETLQALARRTAAAAERVVALAGPHQRLVVFGGGSRSPVWLQAKAAVLGVPVLSFPVPEAAARGAALAAGVAVGWWPTPAAGPTPPLDAPGSDCRAQP